MTTVNIWHSRNSDISQSPWNWHSSWLPANVLADGEVRNDLFITISDDSDEEVLACVPNHSVQLKSEPEDEVEGEEEEDEHVILAVKTEVLFSKYGLILLNTEPLSEKSVSPDVEMI